MLLDDGVQTIVTILGTCGVCEREIACQDGRLVHHGYKRPGDGQIHGDCFAVGYEPYERSTKACEDYRQMVAQRIPSLEARLAALEAGTVTYIRKLFPGRRELIVREYAVGVSELWHWADALRAEISETRYALNAAQAEVARMQRLIDGFELRELGTETRAGQKTREEKEARAAERAAKRTVRAEKEAAKAAKKAAREAKAEAVKAKYRGELEALAEKAEATDELGAPETRAEAKRIIERMEKECRKTPKVSFYARDLGWDDVLVRVGLASRREDGWVQHELFHVG